ncbi:MAG: hypothetical protein AMJ53_17420 [Gammaproteobacteria bacterium SG8_11]|nr:MAG: hypothetical protein AMJ53_17420 [Gammaproteobacteria bacterium SG8_11]
MPRKHYLAVVLLLLSGVVYAAPYTYPPGFDANAAAGATNGDVRAYAGDAESINNNLTRPVMSSDQMTTFNGANFSAQMACPSSTAFLEILIAPGASGDISTITVSQDIDVDGAIDQVYTSPIHMSGICANGMISCDPGTWNNCQAYRWETNVAGELSLNSVSLDALGGCYCVNNHCGSNLVMSNLSTVLSDFGGGAVAALSAFNPLFTVSKVEVTGPVINYYGQDMGNCGQMGTATQAQYYSNPAQMATDTTAALTQNLVLPNSTVNPTGTVSVNPLYQTVSTSLAAQENDRQMFSCNVTRNIILDEVTINDIIGYNGGAGGLTTCGTDCLDMTLGTVGDNYWSGTCSLNEHNVSYWVYRPDRIVSATLIRARFDDHIQVSENGQWIWAHDAGWTDLSATSYPPGTFWWPAGVPRCERSTSWDVWPYVDFTPIITASTGAHNFKIRVAVAGGGEGYAYARIMLDTGCRIGSEYEVNNCLTYESDPNCVLVEENVDGVWTYQNYNPTGLTPVNSIQTISGTMCSMNLDRPWWLKQRTYLCPTTMSYSFDDVYDRVATIRDSSQASGFTNYDDYRLDESTGAWVNEVGMTMDAPTVPSMGSCMQACKTRKPRVGNDVAGLGSSGCTTPGGCMQNNNTHYDFFYHECDSNGGCPLEPGEELLKACQCINDFAESTAIMQSMRLAARDMICTSGTPVSLP